MTFPTFPVSLPGFNLTQPQVTQATFSPQRSIGGITADVTLEEVHDDQLVITNHPVEQGASITDHAFKNPARLLVTIGFSNSSPNSGFDPEYVNEMYQQFLTMQIERELLDVFTGRRNYQNMLIAGLHLATQQDTENAAIIAVDLQEVLLVQTQTVAVPPNDSQKQPEKTATPTTTGVKQAKPIASPPTDMFSATSLNINQLNNTPHF